MTAQACCSHGRTAEGPRSFTRQADPQRLRPDMGGPLAEQRGGRLHRQCPGRDLHVPRLRAAPGEVPAHLRRRVRAHRRDGARRLQDRDRVDQGHQAGLASLQRRSVRRERDRPGPAPWAVRRYHHASASRSRPEADRLLRCDLRYDDEGLHDGLRPPRDHRHQGVRGRGAHEPRTALQPGRPTSTSRR